MTRHLPARPAKVPIPSGEKPHRNGACQAVRAGELDEGRLPIKRATTEQDPAPAAGT